MAIFLRGQLEEEIERIRDKLEKDLGVPMSKTNAVRKIIAEYKRKY